MGGGVQTPPSPRQCRRSARQQHECGRLGRWGALGELIRQPETTDVPPGVVTNLKVARPEPDKSPLNNSSPEEKSKTPRLPLVVNGVGMTFGFAVKFRRAGLSDTRRSPTVIKGTTRFGLNGF